MNTFFGIIGAVGFILCLNESDAIWINFVGLAMFASAALFMKENQR